MTEIPKRTPEDFDVEYWVKRVQSAHPDERMFCARNLVGAKRARGDYPMVQAPMSTSTEDAIAKQELEAMDARDPDQVGEAAADA